MRPKDAERMQRQLYASLTGEERSRLGADMCEMGRRLLEDGIRQRHPDYTGDEIRGAMAHALLPPRLAEAVVRRAQ